MGEMVLKSGGKRSIGLHGFIIKVMILIRTMRIKLIMTRKKR